MMREREGGRETNFEQQVGERGLRRYTAGGRRESVNLSVNFSFLF